MIKKTTVKHKDRVRRWKLWQDSIERVSEIRPSLFERPNEGLASSIGYGREGSEGSEGREGQ